MRIENLGAFAYLVAENIPVAHGFTGRAGGVSHGYLESLNLGMHRGDDPDNVVKNYHIVGDALGFDPKKLVFANQIHSNIVRVVTEQDCLGSLSHRDYPECDGLVTNTPGVALTHALKLASFAVEPNAVITQSATITKINATDTARVSGRLNHACTRSGERNPNSATVTPQMA